MTERRKLYTGDESAGRGLLLLRLVSISSLLFATLFILLFERAKHDPGLAGVNPFAEDPYDVVGSFGVQLAFACSILSAIRAFGTDLKTESLYNRYTYTLRAIGVSQLAIIVTMLADLVALVRHSALWNPSRGVDILIGFTGGLLLLSSGFCLYLIRLANRRSVCSKNPLRQVQVVPFLMLLGLLGIYPGGWRDGIAGAIATASAGMGFLFFPVALLSKAMFPCPDVPEKDLVDDLYGICQTLKPRSGFLARLTDLVERSAGTTGLGIIKGMFNPRKHEWTLLTLIAILAGVLVASIEIFSEGPSREVGQTLLVAIVYIVLESAGVFLGYALLKRFLGLIRSE